MGVVVRFAPEDDLEGITLFEVVAEWHVVED